MEKPKQTIKEFFAGKNVFITGGSGFMGKVLIEKLLRSCKDLNTIYMLTRNKKNETPEQRLEKMLQSELFYSLRSVNRSALNKIKVIKGDMSELGLGISEEDKQLLTENVNVIYNVAASVRFDDPLKNAVIQNTRSVRELVGLASQMKNLTIFVHVSTTYCNVDKKIIEEKIYPPHCSWKGTIKLVETMDSHSLEVLTKKYLGPFPNTYTFTKNLGEHVVNDLCQEFKIPAVIFRPSIVVSIAHEPFPGWNDNFNGPIGLLTGVSKGLMRTIRADTNCKNDYMPVDWCIKTLIAATWERATQTTPEESNEIKVYNGSNNGLETVTPQRLTELAMKVTPQNPIIPLWYIKKSYLTNSAFLYNFFVLFYQLLPAILVDAVLKLVGKKPILVKLQRKIYIALDALYYFMSNEWTFVNDRMLKLRNSLHSDDIEDFSFEMIGAEEYCLKALSVMKYYLLHEKEPPHVARKIYRRFYFASLIFNTIWYIGVFYILFFKLHLINFVQNMTNELCAYFESL